jgi:hypothetical protein
MRVENQKVEERMEEKEKITIFVRYEVSLLLHRSRSNRFFRNVGNGLPDYTVST